MVDVAPYTFRTGLDVRPVQVRRGIVVHVRDETIHVEDGKVGIGVAVGDQELEWSLVFEHVVHRGRVLVHRLGDLCVIRCFVGPVLVRSYAVEGVVGVQRREMQGRRVHEDEHASTGRVELVEHLVHARRVVGQHLTADLAVGQERPDAEVVGADPQCVHGGWGGQARGEVWFGGSGVDALCLHVGLECWNLVLENRWEGSVDCREPSVFVNGTAWRRHDGGNNHQKINTYLGVILLEHTAPETA